MMMMIMMMMMVMIIDVSIMNDFQEDEGGFAKKWDGNQGLVREL